MGSKAFLAGLAILLLLMVATPLWSLAAEKVKVGTASKTFYPYNLVYLAAEERGLWKEGGLEAELVLFLNATALHQAMATGHVEVGMTPPSAAIQAAAVGAPIVVVAHFLTKEAGWKLWVLKDSPIKEVRDLKGTKIGIAALGTASHAYGRVFAKITGMEKEIKFVALGTGTTMVAALKTGAVDSIMSSIGAMINLMASGEVRTVFSVADYLPKAWAEHVIVARKDFLDSKVEAVRRVAKVFSEASKFLKENPKWALAKLKGEEYLLSDKAAQIAYDLMIAKVDFGKIDREAIENIKNFMVEYGIVTKEKAPPLDAIYRNIYN